MDTILSNGWMAENKIIPFPEYSQVGVRNDRNIFILSPIGKKLFPTPAADDFKNRDDTIDTTPMRIYNTTAQYVGRSSPPPRGVVTFVDEIPQLPRKLQKFWCPTEVGQKDDTS